MAHLLFDQSKKIWGCVAAFVLFILAATASVSLGQITIPFSTVVDAFVHFDPAITEHMLVRTTRLTRAIIAMVIGGALAVAGAYMQALTRNPLASPSIFGINAGAMFFIVLALSIFPAASMLVYMWVAFLGAAVAAVIVYFLGSLGRDGLSPVKMVLAGSAVAALFASFTQGTLVLNEENLESVLFWMGGSVSVRTMENVQPLLPIMGAAFILALCLARPVNVLISGDDVARGLGLRLGWVKFALAVVIVVLAGGSVAMGGTIAFIGLIVPHIVRGLVGQDYRWIVPYCALMGASLLLCADVLARFIIMPQEMPIGVLTALMGTPFFIYIARRGFVKK
ncbi:MULTISPECIES: FecCD family ABC transporter permease [Brevibacillus]|jgi:iron complex transport system permease protein|uniref:FecCD family ABC transporter permease n=1 Tax=Brevibacillus TaxID=55080 RepID=UPI000F09A6BB|nr:MULTISPECIES: iron ABC transporter permease [Brevibacillus]MBU8713220.1 iron ABC transporter permease [Brevibacillus parabrevis]MED2255719.1 iron ABC transporter permease [Brevibacillus parabrevis]NRQ55095.1 iron ABC transporter permease [Brevibacillus sp. HD1.4A]RNB97427.1 iron ABC transporter permease [Brevibacillus parabrevis]UED69109.1 iron ABC transporter permease [Brevibacillus sp. HD3.3A]